MQDYIVTPRQLWLDGLATSEGQVSQFVAMSMRTGYTVEAQVIGEDVTGGLQFEITAADMSRLSRETAEKPIKDLFIKVLGGKTILLTDLSSMTTIKEIKALIQDKDGIPPDRQRLIKSGAQLEDGKYHHRVICGERLT